MALWTPKRPDIIIPKGPSLCEMFMAPMDGSGFGAGGGGFPAGFYGDIQSVGLDTNLKVCLDAGHIDSYSGSGQTWADLTANGYDMSGQNTVTFNGVAGSLSSSEYWSFDASDYFVESSAHGWDDNFATDGATWTVMAYIYLTAYGDEKGFAGNLNSSGQNGFSWTIESSGTRQVQCNGGGVTESNTTDSATGQNGWYCIGVSYTENGGNASFHYKNGAYDQVSSSDTFDASRANSMTAGGSLYMGAKKDTGGSPLPSGSRMAGFFSFSTNLSKAQMDSVYNATKTRFGL